MKRLPSKYILSTYRLNMASSMKFNKSRAPSSTCPGGCRFTISARDPHVLCPACLGPEHAQAALQTLIACKQCSRLYGIAVQESGVCTGCVTIPYSGETGQHPRRKRNLGRCRVGLTSLLLRTSSAILSLSRWKSSHSLKSYRTMTLSIAGGRSVCSPNGVPWLPYRDG